MLYLSSLHDLLSFRIKVEIPPKGFEKHLWINAHPLTVHEGKMLDAAKIQRKIWKSQVKRALAKMHGNNMYLTRVTNLQKFTE